MKYTAVTVLETGVLRKQVDGGGWIPVPRWAALEWPCLWTRASFILQNQPFVPLFVVSSRGERKPISHRHTHATRIAKNQNFNTVRIVPPKIFLLLRHPKSPCLLPVIVWSFGPSWTWHRVQSLWVFSPGSFYFSTPAGMWAVPLCQAITVPKVVTQSNTYGQVFTDDSRKMDCLFASTAASPVRIQPSLLWPQVNYLPHLVADAIWAVI